MARKHKTEEDYHKLAESRGFKWVGGVLPKYIKDLTWWECEKGHKWLARYGNINNGSGCPYCAGKAKKVKQDYYNVANTRIFVWVGEKLPRYVRDKTQWKCKKCSYVWEATYDNINRGSGCPYCSRNIKKTKKDYHNLANSREFKWLGNILPKNVHIKSWWKCEKGHRWLSKYNDIYNGNGCPHCAGLAKKTKDDYYILAKFKSFKWLGDLPKNVMTKTKWQCGRGHIFEANYDNINHGSGCPRCINIINGQRVSKPQRKLNNLLCGSLNYPEGRYRIDVAIMRRSQKIAVEYDCWYWHKGKEKYDVKRDKYLISRGWKIIHIKSGELVPTRKQLNIVINSLVETNNCIYNLYLKDWKI